MNTGLRNCQAHAFCFPRPTCLPWQGESLVPFLDGPASVLVPCFLAEVTAVSPGSSGRTWRPHLWPFHLYPAHFFKWAFPSSVPLVTSLLSPISVFPAVLLCLLAASYLSYQKCMHFFKCSKPPAGFIWVSFSDQLWARNLETTLALLFISPNMTWTHGFEGPAFYARSTGCENKSTISEACLCCISQLTLWFQLGETSCLGGFENLSG